MARASRRGWRVDDSLFHLLHGSRIATPADVPHSAGGFVLLHDGGHLHYPTREGEDRSEE